MRGMVWMPLPIGEDQPLPEVHNYFPDFVMYECEGLRGELGPLLQKCIDKHVRDTGRGHPCPWAIMHGKMWPNGGGYAGFILLWDHSQRRLDVVIGEP